MFSSSQITRWDYICGQGVWWREGRYAAGAGRAMSLKFSSNQSPTVGYTPRQGVWWRARDMWRWSKEGDVPIVQQ